MVAKVMTTDLLADADELLAQGYTLRQSAERLHVKRNSLEQALRRRRHAMKSAGIPVLVDRSPDQFDAQAIADRVYARTEAVEPEIPAQRKPFSRIEGVRTGGGSDVTHVPLPVRRSR